MQFTALETSRAHTATGSVGQQGGAITGATNATPIVVTTTSAHNLIDGDPIQITGVVGNTAANTNGYAKRTGYSSTTFGLYSDSALSSGVAGNGAYSSGGAVSQALPISSVTGDFEVMLRVEVLTSAKKVVVAIQDSVDGFVSDIVTRYTWNVQGGVVNAAMKDGDRLRKYDIPGMRFGTASATMRLNVLQIDGSASVTVTCGYWS